MTRGIHVLRFQENDHLISAKQTDSWVKWEVLPTPNDAQYGQPYFDERLSERFVEK